MRPLRLAPLATVLAAIFATGDALALPTGADIRTGQGAIGSTSAKSVVVRQDSSRLAIDWQSFGIAAGESVRFVQPGASAIALNRVLGNSRSEIYGNLSANGQVFLVNQNGILFGPSAQVDVGGLVASTLDLATADFMAGKTTFSGKSVAQVLNQGRISAASGGYVALLGSNVRNEGAIEARLGTVALSAGEQVSLNLGGNSLVSLSVDRGVVGALAENRQLIQADGGRVWMSARAADTVVRAVVNNSGVIEANSVSNANGVIRLEGLGASTVTTSGMLRVRGDATGETGGSVEILGERVGLMSGAQIYAAGNAGGGTVLVGGNRQGKGPQQNAAVTYFAPDAAINADAVVNGKGGKVVVWADDTTRFFGSISARGGARGGDGGQVETSGKRMLEAFGSVNAGAPHGANGEWLLDPNDLTIQANAGMNSGITTAGSVFDTNNDSAVVDVGLLGSALTNGTNVKVQTQVAGADLGTGRILVNGAIGANLTSGQTATLNLNAQHNIVFSAAGSITSGGGALNVNLNAGMDAPLTTPGTNASAISMAAGSSISTGGGNLTATSAGAAGYSGLSGITLASINTGAGSLTVNSNGGNIAQTTAALAVGGTTNLNAGAGTINLQSDNSFQGVVNLSSTSGGTAVQLKTVNSLNLGTVGMLQSGGHGVGTLNFTFGSAGGSSLTQTVPIDASSINVTMLANGDNVTLDQPNYLPNYFSLNSSSGVTSWGDVSLRNSYSGGSHNFNIGGGGGASAWLPMASLSIQGAESIYQTGPVTVTGTTTLNSGLDTQLPLANDFQGVVNVSATAGRVILNTQNSLQLGTAALRNTSLLSLNFGSTPGSSLTQTGPINASYVFVAMGADGDNVILDKANTLHSTAGIPNFGTNPFLLSGGTTWGNISLRSDTAIGTNWVLNPSSSYTLDLANTSHSTSGNNWAPMASLKVRTAGTSTDGIAQGYPLVVTGTTSLNAGAGAIDLGSTTNDFSGLVTLVSSNAISIADTHTLNLAPISGAGSILVTADELKLSSGTYSTINGGQFDFFQLGGASKVTVGAAASDTITIDTSASVGGHISLSGYVEGPGSLVLNAGGGPGGTSASGSSVGFGPLGQTTPLNNLSITSGNNLGFGYNAKLSGNLDIAASGVSQGASTLVVGGTTHINTGNGSIGLSNTTNDFIGTVTLVSSSAINIGDTHTLKLAPISGAGSISVTADELKLSSGTYSTINGGQFDFFQLGGASKVTVGAAASDTVNIDTSASVGGHISLNGYVEGPGSLVLNAGGGPGGTSAIGSFVAFGPLGQATPLNNLSITSANTVSFGSNAKLSGNLDIASSGVSQGGMPLVVGGTTHINTGNGSIGLSNTTNDFTGTVTLVSSSAINIGDTHTLNLAPISGAGSISVTADELKLSSGTYSTINGGQFDFFQLGGASKVTVGAAASDTITIDTSASVGGHISLSGYVEGPGSLVLNAGGGPGGTSASGSSVGFGPLGQTTPLNNLSITSVMNVNFNNNASLSGNLDIASGGASQSASTLAVGGTTHVDTGNGSINFNSNTNNFSGLMTLAASSGITINDAHTVKLAPISGAGSIAVTADGLKLSPGTYSTINSGTFDFFGTSSVNNVTVGAAASDTVIIDTSAGSGGHINLGGYVEGPGSLVLNAGGGAGGGPGIGSSVSFGELGQTAPLKNLSIISGSGVSFASGGTTLGGNLDVSVSNGYILFDGPVAAGGSIKAVTSGGDVILHSSGTLSTNATGDALILAASGNLDNSAGGGAMTAPNGRWLAYSTSPFGANEGGLTSAADATLPRLYNRTFGANPPASITQPGSHLVYSYQPTIGVIADVVNRNYGDANPALTYTTSGTLVGGSGVTDTLTGVGLTGALATTATPTSAPWFYPITQNTLVSAAGYAISYTGANLNVNQRPVTVTAIAGQNKVYGNADPGAYGFTNTSLGSGIALSGTLSRATGENVGSYAITQNTLTNGSNPNYSINYVGDNFAITQRPVTVTVSPGQTKVYGNADPAVYSYGNTSIGTGAALSGALARNAGEDVGNYAIIQGTLTNANNTNYSLIFVANNFGITPRAVSVTASPGQTKIYGNTEPALVYSNTSLGSGVALSGALTRAAGENVGIYAIGQGTLTNSSNPNYSLTYVSDSFGITQRAVTVTANAGQTKTYGNADPAGYTYSNSSLGSGVALSGSLTRATGENVGNYSIAQGSITNANNTNYSLTLVSDNFGIVQRPVTVTANAGQTKVYGNADPASYTYSNSSLGSGIALSGALSRTTSENVGSYGIMQGTLTNANNTNYSLTFTADNFGITRRPVAVTASAGQTKVYGDADPAGYTYSNSSLGSGIALSGALSRTTGENVGSYGIMQGSITNANNPNYSLTFASDNFAITQRPLTVAANPGQTKVYGNADPALAYGIAVGTLIGTDTLNGTLSRTTGENVGSYVISQNTLGNSNYLISYIGNNFAITQRPVTVTANAGQTKIYGNADPASYTYSNTSLGSGISLNGALTRNAGDNVGGYGITQGTLTNANNPNYSLTFAADNFAIIPRPLTVAADNKTKLQSYPNPPLTASYTGFASGEGPSDLGGKLTLATTAVTSSPVGEYPITASGQSSRNYSIRYTNGELEVISNMAKEPVRVSIVEADHHYVPYQREGGEKQVNSRAPYGVEGSGLKLPDGAR